MNKGQKKRGKSKDYLLFKPIKRIKIKGDKYIN